MLLEDKKVKLMDGSAIADGEYVPPLFEVPKSDKEKRHEKRLKRLEKEKRKKEKENKHELQIVENDFPQAVNHLSEEQLAHQALIKAGMFIHSLTHSFTHSLYKSFTSLTSRYRFHDR